MANTYGSKKAKGSKFEREIAKKYVEYDICKNAMRQPLSGAIENLKGDINHSHNVAIPFKFIDECKNQETVSIHKWWRQTLNQCGIGEEPVLHFKKNNTEPLTIIRTETFFSLLGEIVSLYNEKSPEVTPPSDYKKVEALNKIKYGIKMIKENINKL